MDRAGNIFFVGSLNTTVWRLEAATGLVTRVAGNGTPGFGGDGGPAVSAQMIPAGIALDAAGNLFVADAANNRIRRVANGIITTIAGNGTIGFGGDNGPATSAQFNAPIGVAVDAAGNLYIADANNNRVRKVTNGVISTVAGNGAPFFGGDSGPAINASLGPGAVALDTAGNLYIADVNGGRIRKVTNGIITTIAGSPGSGAPGSFGGDGGPATSALLSQPRGIVVDSSGSIYVADSANNRIRKITNGVITTIAGGGATAGLGGFGGDNGPATSAVLGAPSSVAIGPDGTVFIGDSNNSRVRGVTKGVIFTVVGGGSAGDNGPATSAWAPQLAGVIVDSSGALYFADRQNRRVRGVSGGVITTAAGSGSLPDGFPAIGAELPGPVGVAVDAAGDLYISDNASHSVRKVSQGIIATLAGTGTAGYGGDGGPGTRAQLAYPSGIAVDPGGNVYIADTNNNRVRKLSSGVITNVAGNGTAPGFSGDNGPATLAQLNFPTGLALDSAGDLYIADGHRIRRVSNGIITTVAGNTAPGFGGDNGPATAAQLNSPTGIALDTAGNLYIADVGNRRIRKVSSGVITTIAGNDSPVFSPDGTLAGAGGLEFNSLNQPFVGLAVDSAANIYFTDAGRVRILAPTSACNLSARPSALQAPAIGGNLTISIQTDPACPWSVVGLPDWLTVSSAASSDSGLVTVTIFATGNAGGSRSTTIFAANNFISVTQAGSPFGVATIKAVTNSASNRAGPVAPGETVVVHGSGIGPGELQFQPDPSAVVDTNLAGTQVFFNGIPAPIVYASGTQVAAIVPYGASGTAELTVTYAPNQGTASAIVPVTAAAPGLFTADSSGKGQAAAANFDGSINSASNPAPVGSVVSLLVTGEGQTWPVGLDGKPASDPLPLPFLPVGVTIGGKSANINYAGGAPGLAGVMQIKAEIPTGVSSGPSVPLEVQVGGIPTQAEVTIAVRN